MNDLQAKKGNMKYILEVIFYIIGGFVIIFIGSYYKDWEDQAKSERIKKYAQKTLGEITQIYPKTVTVKYEADGKEYRGNYHSFLKNFFLIGEKYEIIYNANDPSEFDLFMSKRIIPTLLGFNSTYTEKFYLIPKYNQIYEYHFLVNNQIYTKGIKIENLEIKKRRYLVKYNPENPQNAYILIDGKWH